MKKAIRMAFAAAIIAVPISVTATDVVNGWSINTTIIKIHSLGSQTIFKLSGVSDGCGHPDFWALTLDDSAKSKAKLSILLAGYATGKNVTLRCENSAVTDFEVFD